MTLKQTLRDKWSQALIGDFTPHDIASGFAIGTFIALLPTFGLSILLVVFLLAISPSINKPAALLALAIWNPLTQIPLYTLSYQIGELLYSGAPVLQYEFEVLNQAYLFTRRFLTGHLVLVMTITIVSYITLLLVFKRKFITKYICNRR